MGEGEVSPIKKSFMLLLCFFFLFEAVVPFQSVVNNEAPHFPPSFHSLFNHAQIHEHVNCSEIAKGGASMQVPAAANTSASPAPVISNKPSGRHVSYEEIYKAAKCSVLMDFYREKRYLDKRRSIAEKGEDIQIIPVSAGGDGSHALVRASTSRLLKEHGSASWSAFFYQFGVYGLTGVSSISTTIALYLGIYHNRLFLPIVPMGAAVTWRLWGVLEDVWNEQRYIDNAAKLREERQGNPMNAVVKRRRKLDTTADEEAPATDLME